MATAYSMNKPKEVPQKEWAYACKRAQQATDYAAMFPLRIGPNDKKFQSPMWQWQNEVAGRYNQRVGG